MLEERDGWFIVNVKDARWKDSSAFGKLCIFPAGVSHVVVGTDGPCAVLFVGHREEPEVLFYPESELARRYNAESPRPTPDPEVAYSDVERRLPVEAPEWPLR